MTTRGLSEALASLAPALGDHLWQSTLFAAAAALLTLAFRKNHARDRYRLWLVASIKFLVPFSLLAGIRAYLAPAPAATPARFYVAMNEVSQPFTQPSATGGSAALSSLLSPGLADLLPELVAGLWLCGFIIVLSVWYLRWRKISIAVRAATPLIEGREVEALRRVENIVVMRKRIGILLSPAAHEPGIFGILRPFLLWPRGISEQLEDGHLEAIIAHEAWHVRRRDNLAAAFHMIVEAAFWFHPLVWWLGARLVDERERACDEGVLDLGGERRVYAESILKTCDFCLGSRLACVSGVTGADLKKRIVRIMTQHRAERLDFNKKLLLGAAGLAAVAIPAMLGTLSATPCRAESAVEAPAVVASGTPQPESDKPGTRQGPVKAASSKTKTCSKSVRQAKLASANNGDMERQD